MPKGNDPPATSVPAIAQAFTLPGSPFYVRVQVCLAPTSRAVALTRCGVHELTEPARCLGVADRVFSRDRSSYRGWAVRPVSLLEDPLENPPEVTPPDEPAPESEELREEESLPAELTP